jgi:hypothetical protein
VLHAIITIIITISISISSTTNNNPPCRSVIAPVVLLVSHMTCSIGIYAKLISVIRMILLFNKKKEYDISVMATEREVDYVCVCVPYCLGQSMFTILVIQKK